MSFYDRQEEFKLKKPKAICVVGCGGVGYWVAKFAAMSGIEKIYLFDPDTVEEHNLNRLDFTLESLGRNKADITREVINSIRPECTVYAFPFILQEHTYPNDSVWLIDCTDNIKSQMENQETAKKKGSRYVKAGYNGESITIANVVAEWGDAPDGYTIVPSWVVPATIVAALTIGKVMKYEQEETAKKISQFYDEKIEKKRRR